MRTVSPPFQNKKTRYASSIGSHYFTTCYLFIQTDEHYFLQFKEKDKTVFMHLTYWFYIGIYEISINQETNKQLIHRTEKIITKYKPWT